MRMVHVQNVEPKIQIMYQKKLDYMMQMVNYYVHGKILELILKKTTIHIRSVWQV